MLFHSIVIDAACSLARGALASRFLMTVHDLPFNDVPLAVQERGNGDPFRLFFIAGTSPRGLAGLL